MSSKVKTYNWSSPPTAPWIPFESRFSLYRRQRQKQMHLLIW